MKRVLFFISFMLAFVLQGQAGLRQESLCNIVQRIHFKADPVGGTLPRPRGPIEMPTVFIEAYTLTFDSSCHNCTLRIVNAENEVEYTTTITSDTLVLPSTLEGQYEIQIIQGEWCFYGDIEL